MAIQKSNYSENENTNGKISDDGARTLTRNVA